MSLWNLLLSFERSYVKMVLLLKLYVIGGEESILILAESSPPAFIDLKTRTWFLKNIRAVFLFVHPTGNANWDMYTISPSVHLTGHVTRDIIFPVCSTKYVHNSWYTILRVHTRLPPYGIYFFFFFHKDIQYFT